MEKTEVKLSDIEYFTSHPAPKYHFNMQVFPLDHTNEWEHDLQNWDEPPIVVRRKTLQQVQFSCNDVGYALFKMKQFADRTGCCFKGEHYQFPANRVVRVSFVPESECRVILVRKISDGAPLSFYRYVKKTFGIKIDEDSLDRISQPGYPDHDLYAQLKDGSIVYLSDLIDAYQNEFPKKIGK